MSRYIDADRIDWRLIIPANPTTAEENMIYQARKLVESQPTADVVEVVHGKWIPTRKESDISFCSNCESYWIIRDDAYDYLYCPKCGAKMEVDDEV